MLHPMAISLNPDWVVKGISRLPSFFVSSQLDKGVGQNMAKTKALMNGHGFGWILGVGDGQGGLTYYGSWGRKESDMTERLN